MKRRYKRHKRTMPGLLWWPSKYACNAGDTGLIPGLGTKITHATGQLNLHAATRETTCHNQRKLMSCNKDPAQLPTKKTLGAIYLNLSANFRFQLLCLLMW